MRLSRLLLAAVLLLPAAARAQSVQVSYLVTGSANDWTYNFSVKNNFAPTWDQIPYFFGVALPSATVTGSPAPFSPFPGQWNPGAFEGIGPNVYFQQAWIVGGEGGVANGTTLSGFLAHSTSESAATSIQWFVYASSPSRTPYIGEDAFRSNWNPGFTGTLQANVAPEPASLVLVTTGLFGIIGFSRRRRNSAR